MGREDPRFQNTDTPMQCLKWLTRGGAVASLRLMPRTGAMLTDGDGVTLFTSKSDDLF